MHAGRSAVLLLGKRTLHGAWGPAAPRRSLQKIEFAAERSCAGTPPTTQAAIPSPAPTAWVPRRASPVPSSPPPSFVTCYSSSSSFARQRRRERQQGGRKPCAEALQHKPPLSRAPAFVHQPPILKGELAAAQRQMEAGQCSTASRASAPCAARPTGRGVRLQCRSQYDHSAR